MGPRFRGTTRRNTFFASVLLSAIPTFLSTAARADMKISSAELRVEAAIGFEKERHCPRGWVHRSRTAAPCAGTVAAEASCCTPARCRLRLFTCPQSGNDYLCVALTTSSSPPRALPRRQTAAAFTEIKPAWTRAPSGPPIRRGREYDTNRRGSRDPAPFGLRRYDAAPIDGRRPEDASALTLPQGRGLGAEARRRRTSSTP